MKFTFVIILILSVLVCSSQEIKYELYLISPCTGEIEKSKDYYLLKRNGIKYPSSFGDGTIEIPEKGEYELIVNGENHNISICSAINSDTLRSPEIEEFFITHSRPNSVFRTCDKLCDGVKTDYYSDGSVRIKGEFKKGYVVGELKRYYQNGNLEEFSIYNKRGLISIKTLFYENGKIKEFSVYNRRGLLINKTLFEANN